MTTEVDLCNRALSSIAARSTITSLSEGSPEALQCAIHYAAARDELLRNHPWSFARRQVPLAVLAAATGTPENPDGSGPQPMAPWHYQYAVPPDCLRVRHLYQPASGGGKIAFALAGDTDASGTPIKILATNQPAAILVYTARVVLVDVFDPDFQAALVATLAARLAVPVAGDKSAAQYFTKVAADAVLTARAIDGTEDPPGPARMTEWLVARGYVDQDTQPHDSPWR